MDTVYINQISPPKDTVKNISEKYIPTPKSVHQNVGLPVSLIIPLPFPHFDLQHLVIHDINATPTIYLFIII